MKTTEMKVNNLGTVVCGKIDGASMMELFITMTDVSDIWKEDIEDGIEQGKKALMEEYSYLIKKHGWKWSDKEVDIFPQLHVSIDMPKDDKLRRNYELVIFFQDKENDVMSYSIGIPVDINKYGDAFKQEVRQAIATTVMNLVD